MLFKGTAFDFKMNFISVSLVVLVFVFDFFFVCFEIFMTQTCQRA